MASVSRSRMPVPSPYLEFDRAAWVGLRHLSQGECAVASVEVAGRVARGVFSFDDRISNMLESILV